MVNIKDFLFMENACHTFFNDTKMLMGTLMVN